MFADWLAAGGGASPILHVVAPGGMGKTWLLRRCAERASDAGWSVRWADGAPVGGDPGTLWFALSGDTSAAAALEDLSSPCTLIVLDGFDAMRALAGFLARELLPNLTAGSRLVIASRQPLPPELEEWAPLTRTLSLSGLSRTERLRYAQLRGVTEPTPRARLARQVGGHPLALSLALDLVETGVADPTEAPEWGWSLEIAVARLAGDAPDRRLRELLEVAAVVRRLDESLLAAVIGVDDIDSDRARLCSLSAVRPLRDGLLLHEDVRRVVIDHLRWRDPDRLLALQLAALRHYRRQAATATGPRAAAIWADSIYIARDALGLSRDSFAPDADNLVVPAGPSDLHDLMEVQRRRDTEFPLLAEESSESFLRESLSSPGSTVMLCRRPDGEPLGYGMVLSLDTRSLALFPEGTTLATAAAAALRQLDLSEPPPPGASNLWFLSTVVTVSGPAGEEAMGALVRDIMPWLARAGAYLSVPVYPTYARVVASAGAHRLPVPDEQLGPARGAYLLDLSGSSAQGWLEAALLHKPPASLPGRAALQEAVAAAVAAWSDDEVLATSPLLEPLCLDPDTPRGRRATTARNLLARSVRASAPRPSLEGHIRRALADLGVDWLPTDTAPHRRASSGHRQEALSAPEVFVRLQGTFEIRRRGELAQIGEGVPAACVKVIALTGKMSIEELMEALWPEVDPAAGRARLRTTFARVRRIVPELLVRDGDTVSLGSGVVVDAAVFRSETTAALAALRSRSPQRGRLGSDALALYTGELLPTDRLETWASTPRERHARLVLELLDELALDSLNSEEVGQAVHYLERAIDLDPYDEERYVRAAAALADRGWRARAMSMLQRARAAGAELGVPAAPAIDELDRELRSSGTA